MTHKRKKRGTLDAETQGEGHVEEEAETAELYLQATEHQGLPTAETRRHGKAAQDKKRKV